MSILSRRHVKRVAIQYTVLSVLCIWLVGTYTNLSIPVLVAVAIFGLPVALVYASRRRLEKKHWVKKMVRAVQRSLPFPMRARKVYRAWQRADKTNWPDPKRADSGDLSRYEYELHSQHGEDGIIRYLFSRIGFTNRRFLEFGFGAVQSNSLRLMLHEQFGGLFIDGSQEQCDFLNAGVRHFKLENVQAIPAFLNLDNLEEIINTGGLPRDLDLMSIDVDGNDYWFWEHIDFLEPRVLVIEYNAMLGPELSLTIPYDKDFNFFTSEKIASGTFWGVSIAALEKLGKRKGYRLVGCDSTGVNAFFLHHGTGTNHIATLSAADAYRPYQELLDRGVSAEDQLAMATAMPYVEV